MSKQISENDLKDIVKRLKNHERRIGLLERRPSRNSSQTKKESKMGKSYSGPAGGIRLLGEEGFFKSKKDLSSVRDELKKRDYNYPTKSIDNALRRASSTKGLLVALREEGKKIYVERK